MPPRAFLLQGIPWGGVALEVYRQAPQRIERLALQAIANGELRLIDDCGHMSTLERPEEVLAILEEWIRFSVD
jgi:pimeloyl-ACP methyl ester carboxylesterase